MVGGFSIILIGILILRNLIVFSVSVDIIPASLLVVLTVGITDVVSQLEVLILVGFYLNGKGIYRICSTMACITLQIIKVYRVGPD